MRKVLTRYVLISSTCLAMLGYGCKKKPDYHSDMFTSADYAVLSLWTESVRTVIKQSTGCSAPVAARALSYFYIAQYEALSPGMKNHVSLHGKINGYVRTWHDREEDLPLFHWPTVINTASHEMVLELFPTIQPSTLIRVNTLYDSLKTVFSQNESDDRLIFSEEYAKTISANVIAYASTDGGANGHFTNFPTSYNPPNCASCWVFTPPFFQRALQPYWGNNRLFVPSALSILNEFQPTPYSEEPASAFYQDAQLIFTMLQNPQPHYEIIAEFWDDGSGFAGTPPGHYLGLAGQLIRNSQISTEDAVVFLTRLAIIMNDAMILTWKGKYDHNLLRPVTYIHRVISQQFNPIIETPPFPEYPSGHAVMAGATQKIYESVFSNSFSFYDSTHVHRTDIDGSPRYFSNFQAMSEEIADSRWYAGIHYKNTQDQSLLMGRQIAQHVNQSLNLSK
ncbi:MAG: vanadium-dependent haloperoxidase [Flavobacteriales bacterium]|nr:vanadium-dependent haloperoxidase [Flavobacteriales bacterium]